MNLNNKITRQYFLNRMAQLYFHISPGQFLNLNKDSRCQGWDPLSYWEEFIYLLCIGIAAKQTRGPWIIKSHAKVQQMQR